MSLKTEIKLIGDASSLNKATKQASGDLDKFGKKAKGMSSGMKGMFKGILAGLSVAAVVDFGKASIKAAIDDNKAQSLLQLSLRKTTHASAEQRANVEKLISAWQDQTGILDDDLRPAYQILATSTHSVTKANELMQIAMDASTATGKPLNTVASALGRAFNGNKKALDKLIPGLKNAKDPIAKLARSFKGAAKEAANNDPLKQFDVAVANIQESVGNSLLPTLKRAVDWMKSPDGIASIKTLTDMLTTAATDLGTVLEAITPGTKAHDNMLTGFSAIAATAGDVGGNAITALTLGAVTPANSKEKMFDNAMQNWGASKNYINPFRSTKPYTYVPAKPLATQNKNYITINVTNNGKKELTAEEIVTKLKQGTTKYGKMFGQ